MPDNKTPEFETRVTQLAVSLKGGAIFDERTTTVSIEDDGGGEFLVLEQSNGFGSKGGVPRQCLAFDPEEWDTVAAAVRRLRKELRQDE